MSSNQKLGKEGEKFIADYLRAQGWNIIATNWSCRWGEIDLVAMDPEQILAFIEVKTRSSKNVDCYGMLSITERKQVKLAQAASCFLSDNPELVDYPCRFDIALVKNKTNQFSDNHFCLVEYIVNAFEI